MVGKDTKLYYTNGSIKFTGIIDEDLPNGDNCCFYYTNGALAFKGSFSQKGIPIKGKWLHPNSKLFYEGEFSEQGFPISFTQAKIFDSDGQLVFQGTIINGVADSEEEDIFLS